MNIPGLSIMAKRIGAMGGASQQDRMIKDKLSTFQRVLNSSYQAAELRKGEEKNAKGLINPNQLKQDYDDKILSIEFKYGYKLGDIFEWVNTNTYWLIYLQELTELAYFKGNVRRCRYETEWIDEDGNKKKTYLALKGPTETRIKTGVKHDISIDTPNSSLSLLIPKNEDTLKYFQRYSKFYLPAVDSPYDLICWRVEAVDIFSTPGIIEITAVEYYSNETVDDVENGIVDAFVAKPIDPTPEIVKIKGETFIKPQFEYKYRYLGEGDPNWSFDEKLPVLLETDKEDPRAVNIKWNSSYSGQFDLYCNDIKKTIVVESLF